MKEKTCGKLKRRDPRRALAEGSGLIGGLAAAMILLHLSGIGCPFRWLTGIPCAGCGMTRAFLSLMQGHLREAFRLHPLIYLMPLPAAGYLLYLYRPDLIPRRYLNLSAVLAAAVFVLVYAVRITRGDPVLEVRISGGALWRAVKEVKHVLSKLW